jgi:hypothetical protein
MRAQEVGRRRGATWWGGGLGWPTSLRGPTLGMADIGRRLLGERHQQLRVGGPALGREAGDHGFQVDKSSRVDKAPTLGD